MLCHSKLQQSATNAVVVQYILQTACHDRNKPIPSIRKKNNLVLISHLHLCKMTMKRGGIGREPPLFTLRASYPHLHRAECCKVRAMSQTDEVKRVSKTWVGPQQLLLPLFQWVGTGVVWKLHRSPDVVPAAASAVALPWCHSRKHSLFVLQALNIPKASDVLCSNEDYV